MENFKIILVGDAAVGKSSIVNRLLYNRYHCMLTPTIGAAYLSKKLIVNGNAYQLNIWDTAGQERYHSISKVYYKNALGSLFVFDLTNRKSFENIKNWLMDVRQNNNLEKYCIMLVANKCDINKNQWQVTEDEINVLATEHECQYMFTSCYTGDGIFDSFLQLTQSMIELRALMEKEEEYVKMELPLDQPIDSCRC
jgi:small GTP-binding protein